jgi:putative membrane protein
MNRLILAAGLCMALAMPAMAQGYKNDTMAKVPSAQKFVDDAAMTNMFEQQAGKIAQQKTSNPKVDDYGRMIITDHGALQSGLEAAAKVQDLKVPSKLDAKHQKLIKALQSASGSRFLKTFKTQQVEGHKQGVKLFQSYAKNGDNADLKQWAQNSVAKLQKHLQHAEQLPTTAQAPTTGQK